MNILIITPKKPSAIQTLAEHIEKFNSHFNIKVLPVHPKRADMDTMLEAQKLMIWADVIHIAYWRSGKQLKITFPKEFMAKPKILTHFNPYDVRKEIWDEYRKIVVCTQEQQTVLPRAELIPLCIDLNFFKFNEEYTFNKVVIMSVARIESKKGVREVAQICNKLGYKFILVGQVSEPAYMKQILEVGDKNIEFREQIEDEELLKSYYESAVYVCNSVDNFETGPLPILEAMACGVPVLTRNVGLVPDLYDGKNMVVRKGQVADTDDLEKELKELIENRERCKKLRIAGWETVKRKPAEKFARYYSSLYYRTFSEKPLVSIIMPICNRGLEVSDTIMAALDQDYPNYELVIADSSDNPIESVIRKIKNVSKIPIKYIRIKRQKDEYTLAKARNEAIIEAQGSILVFCDDRLVIEPNTISTFVSGYYPKQWLWGTKDHYEKGFVENFSSTGRRELIDGGMFNERIDIYGGMTQEIKERFERQGFVFQRAACNANCIIKSSSKFRKKDDVIKMKYKLFKMYEET